MNNDALDETELKVGFDYSIGKNRVMDKNNNQINSLQKVNVRGKKITIILVPTEFGYVVKDIQQAKDEETVTILAGEAVDDKNHTIQTINGKSNREAIASRMLSNNGDFFKAINYLKIKFAEHEEKKQQLIKVNKRLLPLPPVEGSEISPFPPATS